PDTHAARGLVLVTHHVVAAVLVLLAGLCLDSDCPRRKDEAAHQHACCLPTHHSQPPTTSQHRPASPSLVLFRIGAGGNPTAADGCSSAVAHACRPTGHTAL